MIINKEAKSWINKAEKVAKDILAHPESYDGKMQAGYPNNTYGHAAPYWFYVMDLPEASAIAITNPIYRMLNLDECVSVNIHSGKAYIFFLQTDNKNPILDRCEMIHERNMKILVEKIKDGIKESLACGFDLQQEFTQRFLICHHKRAMLDDDEKYGISTHFGEVEKNEPQFENFVVPLAIFQEENHNSSEFVELNDAVGFLSISYIYSSEAVVADAHWAPKSCCSLSEQKKEEAKKILDQAIWTNNEGCTVAQIDLKLLNPYLGILNSILPFYARWRIIKIPMGTVKKDFVLITYTRL